MCTVVDLTNLLLPCLHTGNKKVLYFDLKIEMCLEEFEWLLDAIT